MNFSLKKFILVHFSISLEGHHCWAVKKKNYHVQFSDRTSNVWLYDQDLQFHIVGAFIDSLGVAISYKFAEVEARKKAYADLYRNCDSRKDCIFQTAKWFGI